MKRKFGEYFRDQILIDSMVFREDGLRHLVAEMGARQIVYGTDMPFPWPVGVDFIGRPFDEPILFRIASAYEAATRHRTPPPEFGPLPADR